MDDLIEFIRGLLGPLSARLWKYITDFVRSGQAGPLGALAGLFVFVVVWHSLRSQRSSSSSASSSHGAGAGASSNTGGRIAGSEGADAPTSLGGGDAGGFSGAQGARANLGKGIAGPSGEGPSGPRSGGDVAIGASTAASFRVTQAAPRGAGSQGGAVGGGMLSESVPQSSLVAHLQRTLPGVKRVTCMCSGTLLQETIPEELEVYATLKPDAADQLRALSRAFEVYLIARVNSDDAERRVLAALDEKGLLLPAEGGINRHKVLFCGTDVGASSIVRQLEPQLHIDTSEERVRTLVRFVPRLLHVMSPGVAAPAGLPSNVAVAASLSVIFGM
eukprot:jgi/Mesvir1/12791/Mv22842-RA.1